MSAITGLLRSRIAALLLSSATAQLVPVLTMPVLSRLFTPAEFGMLGVYLSTVAVLSVAGSWRVEHAVIIEPDEPTALALARLCIVLCLVTGAFVLLVLGLLDVAWLDPRKLGVSPFAYYLIPFGVIVNSLLQVQSARMLRARAVRSLAHSRIAQAVATAVLTLLSGWLLSAAELLIVATLVGQGIGLLIMRRALLPYPTAHLARGQIRALLSRQKRFALFTLPSDLLSASSAQMPTFLLATIFGPAAAGSFLLAQRALLMPLSVIGSAVTDVYKTDASRLYAQSGTCAPLTRKAFAGLGALAVIPAIVLLAWSPVLFATVFGEQWRTAGVLCQILAIPALLRLAATPISYNFYLAQRQAEDLVAQAYGVASMLGIFAFVHLRSLGLYECIVLYGINLTLIYGYYALRSLALATAPKAPVPNAARPTADP